MEPVLSTLQTATLQAALDKLDGLVHFAEYPFSGCHDRAHATYLFLANELGRDAVAKVWVFSPSLLTVAIDGTITSPVDPRWGQQTTLWSYHVAAIVQTPEGQMVIDPVLAPLNVPLTLDQWFGEMTIPAGSAYSIVDGERYLFNNAGTSSFSAGRTPFNGDMYTYSATARRERWLEHALARDATANALFLARGIDCQPLRNVLNEPGLLLSRLQGLRTEPPPTCEPYFAVYEATLAAWSTYIDRYQF